MAFLPVPDFNLERNPVVTFIMSSKKNTPEDDLHVESIQMVSSNGSGTPPSGGFNYNEMKGLRIEDDGQDHTRYNTVSEISYLMLHCPYLTQTV